MRVKEEDLDYRFMRDMDLNTYVVHDSHEELVLPIMQKQWLLNTYKISIEEVLNLYHNYPDLIPMFEKLGTKYGGKYTYDWML